MSFPINNLLTYARTLPAFKPLRTISLSSISLSASHRPATHPVDLRITFPMNSASSFPVILLSHGHGPSAFLPSKEGYAPLAGSLAAQGYAVIQPTHLNSKHAGLDPKSPDGPLYWRSRPQDLSAIIDQLDTVESEVSSAIGRAVKLDRGRVTVLGHSLGGSTVGITLGAKYNAAAPNEEPDWADYKDSRVKAGVIVGGPGLGGPENLTDDALNKYRLGATDFKTMETPTLIMAGDADEAKHLTTRGVRWHADPYTESQSASEGRKSLVWLRDGKHGFGGLSGWDAKEGDDNDADRLEVTCRIIGAWLRGAIGDGWNEWDALKAWLSGEGEKYGWLEAERSN